MDSVKSSKLRFPETTTCNDCVGVCPEAHLDYTALNAAQSKIRSMGGISGCQSSSECQSWQICNIQAGECVTKAGYCSGNSDCSSSQGCNLQTHLCVNSQSSPSVGKCADGTSYGKCSTSNPGYYCTGGTSSPILEPYPSMCNPVPTAAKCADGTESGACSASKPKVCVDGALVDNATKCGCPAGSVKEGNSCTSHPACQKIITEICTTSNETITYNVTYTFDRGYQTVVPEVLTYQKQTCQKWKINYEGANCDIEKERIAEGEPTITPPPKPITEKTVECDRCPSICQRKTPNGITCGACVCPPNAGFCDQTGIRDTIDGQVAYCLNELWQPQKENQETCQNSFECKSNFCSDGVCYNIAQDVKQNKDLLQQIIDFLKKIFGG